MKARYNIDDIEKNELFNKVQTKIKNADEKLFTSRFLDYVKIREEFYNLHISILGKDDKECFIDIGNLIPLINVKEKEQGRSEEEVIKGIDSYLTMSLSKFVRVLFSKNDLDYRLEDLLKIREPLILVSKDLLLLSQYMFSHESWFNLLLHDLAFSNKGETRRIINMLSNLTEDIFDLTRQRYVKQYHDNTAYGEGESFDFGVFEKDQFGDVDIRDFIGSEFAAEDKKGDIVLKDKNQDGVLKLKSEYKLNHLEQLIEVFFKIHLDAQFSNPESIECIELLPKIKRVLKNGVGSENHYFVEGEYQKKIDFIKSRNMAEKFIALFVVLDRDLKIFNHTNVVNGMAHGSDIGSFFGVNLFKYNKGRMGLSESSVRAKVRGLNEEPLKMLYKEIGLSPKNVNDLLANLSKSKLEFIKNKRYNFSK